MVKKYVYGEPFETEAVVVDIPAEQGDPVHGVICRENGFSLTLKMEEKDIVYGLGETVRGINKRGFTYTSWNMDDPNHQENTHNLYGTHNFIIVAGEKSYGLFLDYPGKMVFDIGYTKYDTITITSEKCDMKIYEFEGENPEAIVTAFRTIIGRSYIPPKFGFGFQQSRWGYASPEDFRKIVKEYRENQVPIDMICMDIDYMDHFKDFTLDPENFGDFEAFVEEMKAQNIRLVPIIDAGVKIEEGYDVYEEGVQKGYFCKREDGSEFVAAVWPGYTHFPDFLQPEAREWFGNKYQLLTEKGIEGFWNDMNEPSIFYTPEGLESVQGTMESFLVDPDGMPFFMVGASMGGLSHSDADYKRMYHKVGDKMVCHYDIHNLFGYNMTRAAGEAFERFSPDKRILMYSRSSYTGMHRYGGIWQGDNKSWWSHLAMNVHMMPSLNMMGLLYTGADLAGFGADTTEDLALRWEAFGAFTPLMRNHSAKGTREQEFYQFHNTPAFRHIHEVRYSLIPYLYSEFMKAALGNDMMFRPMAFAYLQDEIARETEDQLLIGQEIMIAPVITQNAGGRTVYLPEPMKRIIFRLDGTIAEEELETGLHYVKLPLGEIDLYIRPGKAIPVCAPAQSVDELDYGTIRLIGYEGASYKLYNDDGYSRDYENPANWSVLKK